MRFFVAFHLPCSSSSPIGFLKIVTKIEKIAKLKQKKKKKNKQYVLINTEKLDNIPVLTSPHHISFAKLSGSRSDGQSVSQSVSFIISRHIKKKASGSSEPMELQNGLHQQFQIEPMKKLFSYQRAEIELIVKKIRTDQ